MIRSRPVQNKPSKTVQKKHTNAADENIKPVGFNTKGYFDPSEPFNEEYLKVKQQVFEKYRNKKEEIIMLDPKITNKAAFIQKGLLIPSKTMNVNANESRVTQAEPLSLNLLKTYLIRKEKKEWLQNQKFLEAPKLSCDQISLKSTVTAKSVSSRQVSSRISTNSVLKIESEF